VFQRKPTNNNEPANIPPTDANIPQSETKKPAPAKKKVKNKLMSLSLFMPPNVYFDLNKSI